MPICRIPLRVGEVLPALVRRKLTSTRVLIDLKGNTLVAEPEREVSVGDELTVQVLSIFPRIRLRFLTKEALMNYKPAVTTPLDLRT